MKLVVVYIYNVLTLVSTHYDRVSVSSLSGLEAVKGECTHPLATLVSATRLWMSYLYEYHPREVRFLNSFPPINFPIYRRRGCQGWYFKFKTEVSKFLSNFMWYKWNNSRDVSKKGAIVHPDLFFFGLDAIRIFER